MSSTSNYQPLITSLASRISSVSQALITQSTATSLQQEYAKLQASHLSASNQQLLQTATATDVVSSASQAIAQASETLLQIKKSNNQYEGVIPSFEGNLIFLVVFALAMILHTGIGFWYKQWWVMVSFFCGCGLELAGFLTRTLSHNDYDVEDYFLCQIITLTIAPAFIMGGVYILLGKFIMIYGAQFALMRPMAYSYIFMVCDFISLVIQAAGGAMAASAENLEDNQMGTHIMVAGLAFQVFSMSAYVILFLHYFYKINFFNKSGYRALSIDFNPAYKHLRSRKIFKLFPYVVFICVVLIYIRCVYRVIELAQGWSGYLITHELYLFFLDALMIALTAFLLIVFHPGFVFDGRNTNVQVARRSKNKVPEEGVPLEEFKQDGDFGYAEESGSSRRDVI